MNNLSDFANFGELQKFLGIRGAPKGGCQTKVCAPGAKNPRYASGSLTRTQYFLFFTERQPYSRTLKCMSHYILPRAFAVNVTPNNIKKFIYCNYMHIYLLINIQGENLRLESIKANVRGFKLFWIEGVSMYIRNRTGLAVWRCVMMVSPRNEVEQRRDRLVPTWWVTMAEVRLGIVAQWGVLMQPKNRYRMTPGVRHSAVLYSTLTNLFI